jgi:hypothetical protein
MPFKSKAQQGYLYATNPKVAERFSKDTPKSAYKKLPQHVKKKKKSKFMEIASKLGK